ncbi:uncharacterized protein LOC117124987 [Anneissia japonica]|uniref:uncharacterized protein LOC117124987 n=1 Tax=Anneissia japonica TaxID=1529436 RepID=UPI0014256E9E|nr:uncharacterized protein LOC117124987 [Anneissia japonica]
MASNEGADHPSSLVGIQQVEDDVEDRLLNVVSEWWEEYGSINTLKILLHQFIPKVGKAELEKATNVRSLFKILKGIGALNRPDYEIVFEAVQICGLEGVQLGINKIERFKYFEFGEDFKIKGFFSLYQNLILFGKYLDLESIGTIGKKNNIGEDVHENDPWLLILALIKQDIMENMARFIELLMENGMSKAAKILGR